MREDPRSPSPRERERITSGLLVKEVRRGTHPGSRYVRLVPESEASPLQEVSPGELRATAAALRPRTALEGLWAGFRRLAVGVPLPSYRLVEERLNKVRAVAVYASDNLSSSAYATEEILLVLVLAGTGALTASIPVAVAIAVLMAVVVASYTQTVRAYPSGGGAYSVARENLGFYPALAAAAALMVDYVLTVAVSTAAGVTAVTSAFPDLLDYRVPIALGVVAAIVLANLRGLRESASIFALPTYLFIASFAAMIATGIVRVALGLGAVEEPERMVEPAAQSLTLFLVLRAFSSGSAALTGVEAVANGVPTFKPPEARNATVTLLWMAAILVCFFVGVTVLANAFDVVPVEGRSVVSQVARASFGTGFMFYAVQVTTALILLLAANTSFNGFPVMASVLAKDGTMPHQFAFRGDRLALSYGIVALGLAAAGLLVAFNAEVHRLIPLYAVGVFITFTLSEAGMVRHWWRRREAGWRLGLALNGLGALATAVVVVVVAGTKFLDGAWIVLVALPVLVFLLRGVYQHYTALERETVPVLPPRPRAATGAQTVIIPVGAINRAVVGAVEYSRSISDHVTAVHITDSLEEARRLERDWSALVPDVPMVVIESPYRSFLAPFLAYLDSLEEERPGVPVTVAVPEIVPRHWWEHLLHNQTALRLKATLLFRPNTVVVDIPYHLGAPAPSAPRPRR